MRSGSLDTRVTFRQLSSVDDGIGGRINSWIDFRSVWAQFSPERARERIQQGRMNEVQAGVVRVRITDAMESVDNKCKVLIGGILYNVKSATVVESDNMIEFAVETDGI